MPIMDCQIDGTPGVKFGESGTCYPYEEGNEESKAAATKKALAQGIASGEIDVNTQNIKEFAKLKAVEIMIPGTHNNIPIGERELELMERETNESLPYLVSQIGKAAYEHNPGINLKGKLIPGVIDLNHQEDLPESFINIVKNASMKLYTTVKDGIKKLYANFDGVPDDVAEYLLKKYNNRSVEIMPPFFDPILQKVQHWAVRSVGFLDNTMPPAVDGMTPNFVVEFAQRNEIWEVRCANVNPIAEGVIAMADKQHEGTKTPQKATAGAIPEPTTPATDQRVEPNQEILEMQAQIKKLQDGMAEANKRAENAEQRLHASESKTQEQEITMFLKQCEHDGVAIAALQDGVKEALLALPDKEVVKFAASDGTVKEVSPREFWAKYIKNFAPKAPKGEQMPGAEQPLSILEMQKKFLDEKKAEVLQETPNINPEMVFAKAYEKAIAEQPHLYN